MDSGTDAQLLTALRAGDERAFVTLVRRHHDAMLRLASSFVPNVAVAEEVVQDTWVGVLRGIDGFDGGGSWASPPERWIEEVEDRLEAGKLAGFLRTAIGDLPDRQRQVVTLRDIEGLTSEEVCSVLEISESNQRVLLHRGRSRLRQAIETGFGRPS